MVNSKGALGRPAIQIFLSRVADQNKKKSFVVFCNAAGY